MSPPDSGIIPNNINVDMVDQAFTFNSTGGDHIVQVYGELGTTTNAAAGTVFKLYCNGVVIAQSAIYCPASWGATGVSFPCHHRPGAGVCNYQVTHTGTTGSGASRVNRTDAFVTELKK